MISKKDLDELHQAYNILEHPGFRIKIMNAIGTPIEKGFDLLPNSVEQKIAKACNLSIKTAAEFALFTLKNNNIIPYNWSDKIHRMSTWLTGAAGGFFGIPGTLVEIPITTTIILRSIFDIAKSEGENIYDTNVKLAVLQVFALGGKSKNDDLADTAYYTIRIGMASQVKSAYQFLTKNSGKLVDKEAPQLVKLIQKIATRFSIPVTEKAVAQAMPFISAGLGVIINDTFITHFQDMAHAHFAVRRLERKYGADVIKQAYESFKK